VSHWWIAFFAISPLVPEGSLDWFVNFAIEKSTNGPMPKTLERRKSTPARK
jgi:hypothetical protein